MPTWQPAREALRIKAIASSGGQPNLRESGQSAPTPAVTIRT